MAGAPLSGFEIFTLRRSFQRSMAIIWRYVHIYRLNIYTRYKHGENFTKYKLHGKYIPFYNIYYETVEYNDIRISIIIQNVNYAFVCASKYSNNYNTL